MDGNCPWGLKEVKESAGSFINQDNAVHLLRKDFYIP